jgi:hypothetical protein
VRLTVGFSGSGGAGKTPLPTKTFAGSRRIPASGEAAVRCKRCWVAFGCASHLAVADKACPTHQLIYKIFAQNCVIFNNFGQILTIVTATL